VQQIRARPGESCKKDINLVFCTTPGVVPDWNGKEGGQGKNDLPEGLCRTSKKNRKS
jgi:hypothetical protein